MTSVTALPDKWREDGQEETLDWYHGAKHCADELQVALPVWMKITDDPKTRPEVGQRIRRYSLRRKTAHEERWRGFHEAYKGDYWRPIIEGIDTPPEAES